MIQFKLFPNRKSDSIYKVTLTLASCTSETSERLSWEQVFFIQSGGSKEATEAFLGFALPEGLHMKVEPIGEFEHPRLDLTFTINSFYKRLEECQVWDNQRIV